jgi:predicted ATP-dependent endonuclease of OLD family
MKIIRLAAENFKRLRAVEIIPQPNGIIAIRGPNGAGKSSVLDAIMCVFGGGNVLPSKPIRRGAETARLECDTGEIIVTRKFTPAGSNVVVEAATGARFRSPQHMLDELIGAIAFDPLAFTRMDPAKQLEALRRLVKLDVDIDALDGANARDYERRTEVNRDARKLRGQASGIQYPEGLPAAAVDITALTARLQQAGDDNATLERRKARRQQKSAEAALQRRTAAQRRDQAEQMRRSADDLDHAAAELEAHAAQIERDIEEAPALPEPVDTLELVAALEAARVINADLDAKARRATLEAEATALEERSAALTTAMEERTQAKTAAIASAQMPVAGIGFGDGEVLFNDLPLDQASQAEKIRVSVAIAMAANPKLKVLCIRDGSLLDNESWRLLAELVEGADYQCWVEVTDDDAKTGIIIEDGAVREPPPAKPEAQAALALV